MGAATELAGDAIVAAMDGRVTQHASEADRTEAFLPSPCVQNHAANLTFLPGGELACVWFGGTMEGMGDISVWMSRLAPGADPWSPAERLSHAAGRSEQNPVGVPRAPLRLAFSLDDGATFADRRDLETGSGYCLTNNSREGLNRELSYPSTAEDPDGALHVAFTYHRRAIKYVRLAPRR